MIEGGYTVRGVALPQGTEDMPLVSVITVSFNAAATIERTILSVLGQTYPRIEYVVVDGGSGDGTLDILRKHEGRIARFVSEPDEGIYDAMNKGIAMSHGALIGIINSDDWYEPDAVRIMAEGYREDPMGVQFGLLSERSGGEEAFCGALAARCLPSAMIPHPTVFVPRALYDRHGLFDASYRMAADYDLALRLYTRGVAFRMHRAVIANFTRGGACDSHPFVSASEAARLRRRNGVIGGATYRLLLAKAAIAAIEVGIKRRLRAISRSRRALGGK